MAVIWCVNTGLRSSGFGVQESPIMKFIDSIPDGTTDFRVLAASGIT